MRPRRYLPIGRLRGGERRELLVLVRGSFYTRHRRKLYPVGFQLLHRRHVSRDQRQLLGNLCQPQLVLVRVGRQLFVCLQIA